MSAMLWWKLEYCEWSLLDLLCLHNYLVHLKVTDDDLKFIHETRREEALHCGQKRNQAFSFDFPCIDVLQLLWVDALSTLMRSNYCIRVYGLPLSCLFMIQVVYRKRGFNDDACKRRASCSESGRWKAQVLVRATTKRVHQEGIISAGSPAMIKPFCCAKTHEKYSHLYHGIKTRLFLLPVLQHRGNSFTVYECSTFPTVGCKRIWGKYSLNFKLCLTWCNFILGHFWAR